MKKRILILSLFVLILLSPLFSRPQFFFGGGVEWGKLYMDESEMTILKGNTRYSNPKDGAYISHFVPTLEATFIPVADIGVGITCSFGYGGVLGYNNGSKLYSSSDNGYSIFTDSIVDASIGVRYMTVMAKEKYLSFTSYAQYNYRGYFLSRGPINNGYISKDNGVVDNINQHSISLGIGLMERYDAYYFKIDLSAQKPLSFSSFLDSFNSSGWRMSMSATFGVVFTILNENEFMR